MLFSSISFLYHFLPVVIVVYLIAPRFLKNTVLLLSSLVFYYWGEPKYTLLMITSIALGYFGGIIIEKSKKHSALWLGVFVSANLCLLGYFKYMDFFISTVNSVLKTDLPLLQIALPVGISFYTFQSLSYLVDVHRGTVPAQKNPIDLGAYIAMFPQLVAGPIVRYSDIAVQLKSRTHSLDMFSRGVGSFASGLAKKVLVANLLGELVSKCTDASAQSVLGFWLYAVSYTLQIYFDFSGYSDMAIGLGRIFGFEFMENFNYPYISRSITEFWRRWHISLGSWFRDYVYIPLGGNRVKPFRHILNIIAVWALTGMWHGASGVFILWGLYFAALLILEKFFLLKYLKKSKILSHVYVLLLVTMGFVIFNAKNLPDALNTFGGMAGAGGIPLVSAESLYYLRSYCVIILVAIIASTPAPKLIYKKLCKNSAVNALMSVAEPAVQVIILIISTSYLVDGSFNPFLYFRF